MRGGILLAESSPSQLLQRFQCTYLEEAFLNLSQMQENDNVAITSLSTIHTEENIEESLCQDRCDQKQVCKSSILTFMKSHNVTDYNYESAIHYK